MTNKKWIKNFFLNIIILIFIIEINYQLNSSSNRHYVDYIINNILPNTKNKNVDILILGDSVAANAFKNKIVKENIFDLSSNQAISMAGNYFLLKRFLEQNNPPKELFLFTIPQFYQNDLNQIWTYLYFETVFQNDEEFEEIKKIKPNLYLSENKLDKYFETRKNKFIFKNENENFNNRKQHHFVEISDLDNSQNYLSHNVTLKEREFVKIYNLTPEIPMIYLNKLQKLCQEKNIKLNIVIEPSPHRILNLFYLSNWYKYLKNMNIGFYDINEFYKFSDIHFHDGVHISGKINDYYLQLVDENIFSVIKR